MATTSPSTGAAPRGGAIRHPLIAAPGVLGPGPDAPSVVHVFIEIPKGARNKYEIDEATGLIKLSRYLYGSSHYPGDYGFIPGTSAEDGDALDVLVVVSEPTFPGCLIHTRPVAVFRMTDDGELDYKIVGVPHGDPHAARIEELEDLNASMLLEIEHFFTTYKMLEGKQVVGGGWGPRDEALEVIRTSLVRGGA